MTLSKTKNQNEEQETEPHETMYRLYKLLYYLLIIIGATAALLMIDVALNNDYRMRDTMGGVAIAGIGILVIERIMDYRLKKWGVIA